VNPNEFFGELKRRNVYKVGGRVCRRARDYESCGLSRRAERGGSACAHAAAAIRSLIKVIRPQKI
jgi:hypothetical protein